MDKVELSPLQDANPQAPSNCELPEQPDHYLNEAAALDANNSDDKTEREHEARQVYETGRTQGW